MSVFVVLALTILVVSAAATAVVARQLWLTTKHLGATVRASSARITPLVGELEAELAVTATELESIGDARGRP